MKKKTDMVILDVNFPDGDGFSFLCTLRQYSDIPVLMVTANDMETDEVTGLALGADDYITKPFLPEELILRVTAVLKRVYRVKSMQEAERIALGRCTVDLGSGIVHWKRDKESNAEGEQEKAGSAGRSQDGVKDAVRNSEMNSMAEKNEEITLTAKEYAILQKLVQERGRIVTIDALCDAVWQEENYGYENTLVVHIRRLREKIEEDPSHPKYLLTVRGLGYRLV